MENYNLNEKELGMEEYIGFVHMNDNSWNDSSASTSSETLNELGEFYLELIKQY